MNTLPQPGMFVRPVFRYPVSYCLEVTRVLDCDDTHGPGVKHITATRWGIDDDGQPFDDGHSNQGYYCDRIHAEREGVWRFLSGSPSGYGEPMHWHLIDIKPKTAQQQELFQ